MSPPAVVAENLQLSFGPGSFALANVSLAIAPGEFLSIVGPSGCGKSTFLRLVAGLIKPTSGRISFGGVDGKSVSPANNLRQAFVFQDATLLPWRTVEENVRLPFELSGYNRISRAEIDRQIGESLEMIGLDQSVRRKKPRELSGGMRMRVSLARALMTSPQLLLLDEPFAALDEIIRQQLGELILSLHQKQGWTAIFVTHNVGEAVFLSQRVAVMSASPGQVRRLVDIPLPWPRTDELRFDPRFAKLVGEISACLREES